MKQYASKRANKGKTAYRTPSRIFNQLRKNKNPLRFGGSSFVRGSDKAGKTGYR